MSRVSYSVDQELCTGCAASRFVRPRPSGATAAWRVDDYLCTLWRLPGQLPRDRRALRRQSVPARRGACAPDSRRGHQDDANGLARTFSSITRVWHQVELYLMPAPSRRPLGGSGLVRSGLGPDAADVYGIRLSVDLRRGTLFCRGLGSDCRKPRAQIDWVRKLNVALRLEGRNSWEGGEGND